MPSPPNDAERQVQLQADALAALARNEAIGGGELEPALAVIAETAARTMQVQRVGVWALGEEGTVLRCVELFELAADRHTRGLELTSHKYPAYFAAAQTQRTIDAHQAQTDPRTREFADDYLAPLGITSMLDAPILRQGRLIGVVCHEHIGPPRRWTDLEQAFAGSIADFAALALETSERRKAEQQLRQLTATLEQRVRRRTDELQQANEQLKQRNVDLQQFTYAVSHDLQEPLRAVAGYCQLLRRRYAGRLDDDADEFLQFAVDGAHRMQRLIDGLLELSRVETSGTSPEWVEAGEALDEALANLAAAIDRSGARVEAETLPRVQADRSQLMRLFQNLVANAIKYRGDDPVLILVTCRETDSVWEFAVRDNGIGIAAEHLERIFQVFQRLHTPEQ